MIEHQVAVGCSLSQPRHCTHLLIRIHSTQNVHTLTYVQGVSRSKDSAKIMLAANISHRFTPLGGAIHVRIAACIYEQVTQGWQTR
jgi:hypothetical protein